MGSNAKVVILGSGTPNPDPEHSGNSIAVIVNDIPYIVDFGPGLIRNAAKLSPEYGGCIKALSVQNIKRAFLTHMHSDHTTGYADLILTPWVLERDKPLEVYGPDGLKNMTEHILAAYKDDIDYRRYGLEPANDKGWRVNAYEITNDGEIYRDANVMVEAFKVIHGTWPNAYGYKFTTADKKIVISGDTMPCENLLKYAEDADILVHEAYSSEKFKLKNKFWREYHKANHTSTYELAEIANKIKPKLLVLYHVLYWDASDQDILDEVTSVYKGNVVISKDLDIYS